ncbi:MAG: 16S rRNA (cytosine(967)-C(5))-methyltransferase RsmB [Xanthomonadaceae bacterium]|nr:16S rRNA (cytosine(967)-C(5))-methyltransferase RsmB [Xanthomonadaceae bacterium]
MLAARALQSVLDRRQSLSESLAGLEQELASGPDRALVRRLCYRALRNYPALEWRLQHLLDKPLARKARIIHFLLLSALDQLLEKREPGPAIVHASVAAARLAGQPHLAGLVNAVLRNYQRRADPIERALPADPEIALGYPGWLLDALRKDWPDRWQAIALAGNQPPPIWLRVNRRRADIDTVRRALNQAGHESETDPRFSDAIRLRQNVRISDLPGFEQGHFSIQDAAAQTVADLIDARPGQRVLDACAAPGGKAAHLLERHDLELTALELDGERAARIERTFARLGLRGRVLVGDASRPQDWWDGRPFDRILVDAPCSATGVLRRHPDVRWLRRPRDLDQTADLQQQILNAVWPLLAPGGLLVYASCSILHAENRDQGRSFIANHEDAQPLPATLAESIETRPGNQILPGSLDRDGFYYLRLRRLR